MVYLFWFLLHAINSKLFDFFLKKNHIRIIGRCCSWKISSFSQLSLNVTKITAYTQTLFMIYQNNHLERRDVLFICILGFMPFLARARVCVCNKLFNYCSFIINSIISIVVTVTRQEVVAIHIDKIVCQLTKITLLLSSFILLFEILFLSLN